MSNIPQKIILRFKDDAFAEQLKNLLMRSGKVKLGGVGIFEIRAVAARKGYNVSNGEDITIPAHNKLIFKPTKKLRDSIQVYGQ